MSDLILSHGGYRRLKSFQISQLVYDVTVQFCKCYVSSRSRTRDQMTQAARSGVQNIAEGSQAAATSKKTELKLTQVARASHEELRLDYEDFLRQNSQHPLHYDDPILIRFKAKRCNNLQAVREWVSEEQRAKDHTLSAAALAANAALSLINLACYLLDRQVQRLARDFENQGGFTERLYRTRKKMRGNTDARNTDRH